MARRSRPWTVSEKRSVQIPQELHKTFTYDQGREMRKYMQLTERTGMAVYFCNPIARDNAAWTKYKRTTAPVFA